MGTNVHLTPELEHFARDSVTQGRYNNVSEVVRDGLRLLQDRAAGRAAFEATLIEAMAEADRDGTHDIDDVMAELDQIITAAERK
ncbi:type II toxin-antitoxin system ParD family antitoxin [soil metagenome]